MAQVAGCHSEGRTPLAMESRDTVDTSSPAKDFLDTKRLVAEINGGPKLTFV